MTSCNDLASILLDIDVGKTLLFRGMRVSSRAAGTTVPHKSAPNLGPISSWAGGLTRMPVAEYQGFSPHGSD
jgi:hypothetical protein